MFVCWERFKGIGDNLKIRVVMELASKYKEKELIVKYSYNIIIINRNRECQLGLYNGIKYVLSGTAIGGWLV